MDHPVIDWELGAKLAGDNPQIAQELLALLTKDLLNEIAEIKRVYDLHDYIEVKRRVHKLHGALSYCGVPRLKFVTSMLENALKNMQLTKIPQLFACFEIEAKEVVQQTMKFFIEIL